MSDNKMTRTLGTERLYAMGNYENIKFSNILLEIPEEVAMNPKAVGLLFTQQLLSCEIAYREYKGLVDALAKTEIGEALDLLKAKRQETYKELLEEITKEEGEE